MNEFNKTYWEKRYQENRTGWDLGQISTPLKSYINQIQNKDIKILIPGAGNGYEAQHLWEVGFKNTFVLDIAKKPLKNLKNRVPYFPKNRLLNNNFFEVDDQFDLIIEQTFFCALHPNLREKYIEKMHRLLKPNGKLVGLFFDFPLAEEGPPFGGSLELYESLFQEKFKIKTLEKSTNSVKERIGKELFFIFEKK